MGLLRAHLTAVAVVSAAVLAATGLFLFARPQYHPYQMPSPPDDGLSYTHVSYSAADAKRAFATQGIALLPGSRSAAIVDLHSASPVLAVDVFGDRKVVVASGFANYYTFADGHYVKAPKTCAHGAHSAERWRGNVRVIVECWIATTGAPRWLRRVDAALAALPAR